MNRPVSFSVKMYKSFALVKSSLKVSSGFDNVGVVKLEIKLPLYAERYAGTDHHHKLFYLKCVKLFQRIVLHVFYGLNKVGIRRDSACF